MRSYSRNSSLSDPGHLIQIEITHAAHSQILKCDSPAYLVCIRPALIISPPFLLLEIDWSSFLGRNTEPEFEDGLLIARSSQVCHFPHGLDECFDDALALFLDRFRPGYSLTCMSSRNPPPRWWCKRLSLRVSIKLQASVVFCLHPQNLSWPQPNRRIVKATRCPRDTESRQT
jgi:hypothetical protein